MTSYKERMTEEWGSAATHSEYKINERITYCIPQEGGAIHPGTIIWALAPHEVDGKHIPTSYVVESDLRKGFPDIVWSGDIIASTNAVQNPTLEKCPYCMGMHERNQTEQCPLNPNTKTC